MHLKRIHQCDAYLTYVHFTISVHQKGIYMPYYLLQNVFYILLYMYMGTNLTF